MARIATAVAAAVAAALTLAAAPEAAAGEPPPALVDATFAFNIETGSVGFRLHPRAGFVVWTGEEPYPAHGTLDVGVLGGWSHRPPSVEASYLASDQASLEGTGAHHALVLASFGHTVQAETEHGHVFRFGTHLVAGWAWRGDRARLVHEGYGIDREHAESVHGFAGGTISSVGLLFDGVAGPVFEASWLTGPVRGLAHWHMGVGVAVTLGRGVEQFPDRSRLARQ